MAACRAPNVTLRVRRWATIKKTKEPAVTIRCFAPSPKAARYSLSCTAELQMQVQEPVRGTTEKRTVRWLFEELDTLRKTIIARAGRLTRPQGKLTLTLNANLTVQNLLLRFLEA